MFLNVKLLLKHKTVTLKLIYTYGVAFKDRARNKLNILADYTYIRVYTSKLWIV